jgi:hypothetical protein
VPREQETVEKLFTRLIRSRAVVFPEKGPVRQGQKKQGVYVILSPRGKPLHVGRTLRGKGGLAQRLNNHLHNQSSFTTHFLGRNGGKLRRGYRFRYLLVRARRTRALLEACAVGQLCPKYLGLGKRKGNMIHDRENQIHG